MTTNIMKCRNFIFIIFDKKYRSSSDLRGDMLVRDHTLVNLNADRHVTKLRTGMETPIFQGRADQILIDRMLGLDHQDEDN